MNTSQASIKLKNLQLERNSMLNFEETFGFNLESKTNKVSPNPTNTLQSAAGHWGSEIFVSLFAIFGIILLVLKFIYQSTTNNSGNFIGLQ